MGCPIYSVFIKQTPRTSTSYVSIYFLYPFTNLCHLLVSNNIHSLCDVHSFFYPTLTTSFFTQRSLATLFDIMFLRVNQDGYMMCKPLRTSFVSYYNRLQHNYTTLFMRSILSYVKKPRVRYAAEKLKSLFRHVRRKLEKN